MIHPVIPYAQLANSSPRPIVSEQRLAVSLFEHSQRFPDVPLPGTMYTLQESADPIIDYAGSDNLTEANAPAYQQAGDAGRYAIGLETSDRLFAAGTGVLDIATSGVLSLFVHAFIPSHADIVTSTTWAGKLGAGIGYRLFYEEGTPRLRFSVDDGTTELFASVAADHSSQWISALAVIDKDNDLLSLHSNLGSDLDVDISTVNTLTNAGVFALGEISGLAISNNTLVGYAAAWEADALTAAHYAQLIGVQP